jgi:hypothetical protein
MSTASSGIDSVSSSFSLRFSTFERPQSLGFGHIHVQSYRVA